jgi:hypothetical protein
MSTSNTFGMFVSNSEQKFQEVPAIIGCENVFDAFSMGLALLGQIFHTSFDLRRLVCENMRVCLTSDPLTFVKMFDLFIDQAYTCTDFQQYLQQLSETKVHGGVLELAFLASIFECDLRIRNRDQQDWTAVTEELEKLLGVQSRKFSIALEKKLNTDAGATKFIFSFLREPGCEFLLPGTLSLDCIRLRRLKISKLIKAGVSNTWKLLLLHHADDLKKKRNAFYRKRKATVPIDRNLSKAYKIRKTVRHLSCMWEKLEGELRDYDVAVQHMNAFENEMSDFIMQSCVVCCERRIVTSEYVNGECVRCASAKTSVKKFSKENNMIPSPVPPQLVGLTPLEEMMIARAVPVMYCYYKKGGQRGYSGNVLSLPQELNEFAKRLPRPVSEIPMVYIRRHGIDDKFKDFVVRKLVLWEALRWLKTHNPFYSEIEIDENYLQTLPSDGVPGGIQSVEESKSRKESHKPDSCDICKNCDTCDTCDTCVVCITCSSCGKCATCRKCTPNCAHLNGFDANELPSERKDEEHDACDRSFLVQTAATLTQEEILREHIFGTKQNPVPWRSSPIPVNEFQGGLISMCFPTLCPDGMGDVTDFDRKIPVSLTEALPHLTHFADAHPDGSFTYRFASHHTFPFWIFNQWMRHSLLTQTNVYAQKHSNIANMTLGELRDEAKKGKASTVFRGLQVYQANFPGTTGYWYQRTQDLLAATEQLPLPTCFWTISFADYHHNELQKFMPWPHEQNTEVLAYAQKKRMVRDNPHIAAEYFYLRAKSFSDHLHAIFQADWYWNRVEAQRRASLHMHGCFKAKVDCDVIENSSKALLGFLAKKKLNSVSLMSERRPPNVCSLEHVFSASELADAREIGHEHILKLSAAFNSDFLVDVSQKTWYLGVRAEPSDVASSRWANVISGKIEFQSGAAHQMKDMTVVCVVNHLPACVAWTVESMCIEQIKSKVFSRLSNKSSSFGLGCSNSQCLYTVTLLRGSLKTVEYSAYPLPDCEDELSAIVDAGNAAEKTICKFADFIISTWNPHPGKFTEPQVHPSTYSKRDIAPEEETQKHVDIVNVVNRHYQCGPWCLRKPKNSTTKVCRYHFPFELCSETHLEFSAQSKNSAGEVFYRVKIVTKRNDPLLNNYNPLLLDYWRANSDFQLIVDPVAVMEYMCKYASKPEKASQEAVAIFRKVASTADDTISTLTFLRKGMLQMSGARDYGAPEIAFTSLHLPLVSCNLIFESVNLNGLTQIDLSKGSINKPIFKETLLSLYSKRLEMPFVNDMFLGVTQCEFELMNFRNFAYTFKVVYNKLKARASLKKSNRLVLKFYPAPRPHARGTNYDLHCMYQLIKYKPWQSSSDTRIFHFLQTRQAPQSDLEKEGLMSEAWKFVYESFLKTSTAKNVIPSFENEIRQSLYAVGVKQNNEEGEPDDEENQENFDEWMTILKGLKNCDSSVSVESTWKKPLFNWSRQIIDEIPTWLATQKKIAESAPDPSPAMCLDECKCDDCDGSGMRDDETEDSPPDGFGPDEQKSDTPTPKQQFVLDIVQEHVQQLKNAQNVQPLRMLVLGTAGSGKSFLIKKLRVLLRDSLSVCATTGAAGVLIGGSTLHSLVKLPIRPNQKKPLQGNALRKLQNAWKGFRGTPKQFLIVDEISMLGKNALYWVDQRLRQATCVNELFGGVSVLFFGDFGQLFPVRDAAMFLTESYSDSLEKVRATMLYKSFSDVVILDENLRAKDEVFKNLLLRIRNGNCRDDDYELLRTRFSTLKHLSSEELARFDDSVHLFYRKKDAFQFNLEKLVTLQQPIVRFDAVNSDLTAKHASAEIASSPATIVTAVGALVMITSNLWQKAGIFNGLTGRVYDVIYDDGCKPPDLPLAVIVQVSSTYTGPSLLPNVPRLIAVTPVQIAFSYRSKMRWRKQLPLMLASARTIHKCQGMTLDSVVIDIGSKESAAGLTFVALSRVKRLSDLLLAPFSKERFQSIGKNKNLVKRVREDARLKSLEILTQAKFAHLFACNQ